ncbi:hypothetical protein GW17_00018065 [Ensete ventricosum]|nr:hypothetical protein GW17_00018065 [Ensete ventricosum]
MAEGGAENAATTMTSPAPSTPFPCLLSPPRTAISSACRSHNAHKRPPPLLYVAPHNLSCSSVAGVMAPGKGSAVAMGLLPLFCLLAHSEVAGAATSAAGPSAPPGGPAGSALGPGDVLVTRTHRINCTAAVLSSHTPPTLPVLPDGPTLGLGISSQLDLSSLKKLANIMVFQ